MRKTLEAFSVKLRDETDLDALDAELVVRERMQPARASQPERRVSGPRRRIRVTSRPPGASPIACAVYRKDSPVTP